MNHTLSQPFSYAMLFDPAVALAAAQRAAQWDLPRHICRPLDHYTGPRVSAALAAYDAAVESAPVPEEENLAQPRSATASIELDADFDDTDDL